MPTALALIPAAAETAVETGAKMSLSDNPGERAVGWVVGLASAPLTGPNTPYTAAVVLFSGASAEVIAVKVVDLAGAAIKGIGH